MKLGLLLLQLLLVRLHLQARKPKLKDSGVFQQACSSSCTNEQHRMCHRNMTSTCHRIMLCLDYSCGLSLINKDSHAWLAQLFNATYVELMLLQGRERDQACCSPEHVAAGPAAA